MTGSTSGVPARARWVVEQLPIEPGHSVLEVGGSPGAAASLVCARLDTGRMLVVERSAVGARRTIARNSEHVHAGRLEVQHTELADLEGHQGRFDLAFSLNVNLFWTSPATRELEVLRRVLRPGGLLVVAYGSEVPSGVDRPLQCAEQHLLAAGFEQVRRIDGDDAAAVSAWL